MIVLRNQVQPYAWGSRTAIAALQGRDVPTQGTEAELWLGAHPSAPSIVDETGTSLAELITADPQATLGPAVVSHFGARLPYLFKVLAADEPLSLQAHPDPDQAAAGYAAERSKDLAVRSYADPYHKPELLVALDDFEALCGFRDPALAAKVLESFGLPTLAPVVDALRVANPADALRDAVALLLGWPAADRAGLVEAVVAASRRLSGSDPFDRAYALVVSLAAKYPTDMGVVVALLLNHVVLRPGEAVYMPAGNLHAYLRGTGVEIMAASDNVLRGGLTPKHVDVPELMRVLRYEVLADPLVRPVELSPGLSTWPTPVAEFRLVRGQTTAGASIELPDGGPRILLCTRGTATAGTTVLHSGQSVFVSADEPPVVVSGDGAELYQASVNL